jgi:hypothetical protein
MFPGNNSMPLSSFFLEAAMFSGKNNISLYKSFMMTFDNSRTIIGLRIKLFVATVLFLAYVVLTYMAKLIKYPLLGMNETGWTLVLAFIYLVIAFLPMFLNYQFISYSDEGESIVLRYFTAGIIGGKKSSVEIRKALFSGYKTESKFFGLIRSITLFQRIRDGVAKYPPVYISALTKEERLKLTRSLNSFIQRV